MQPEQGTLECNLHGALALAENACYILVAQAGEETELDHRALVGRQPPEMGREEQPGFNLIGRVRRRDALGGGH
jgi:hypothetical protein